MFKLVVLSALVAIVAAKPSGLLGYSALAAPAVAVPAAVSHQSRTDIISKPVVATYAAAPAVYAAAAPVAYSAPLAHAAPLAYAAPLAHAAPLAYAAPLAHAAPLAYAAPWAHAAPLAHAW